MDVAPSSAAAIDSGPDYRAFQWTNRAAKGRITKGNAACRRNVTVASDAASNESSMSELTIDRLEHAIAFTAYCMTEWKMRELLPALKRLEAERSRLAEEGDALDYAEKVLAKSAKLIEQSTRYLPAPQNLDQSSINA